MNLMEGNHPLVAIPMFTVKIISQTAFAKMEIPAEDNRMKYRESVSI